MKTATVRTTINSAVMALVLYVVSVIFPDVEITADNPLIIAVVGVASAVVYTASRWLTDKFPWLGTLLFGVATAPKYDGE